jgi:acetyl esterase
VSDCNLDPGYAAALALIEAEGCGPGDPLHTSLEEARAAQDRYFAFLNADTPPVARSVDLSISGPAGPLPLRIHFPPGAGPLPVIVFVRGAGWWAGGLDSHDRIARLCALRSGCAVLAVDYHRSPEHVYPTQLLEILAALAWTRALGGEYGLDGGRIVLWGESAGATLGVLAAMELRDAGASDEMPLALVLFYGNFDGPGPATRAQSKWVWQQYLGGTYDDPPTGAIPARRSVAGLPPTWLGVGDVDPLLKDTLALQARLHAAGVEHTLQRYAGLPHAFMGLNRLFDGATDAVEHAAGFVRGHIKSTSRKES